MIERANKSNIITGGLANIHKTLTRESIFKRELNILPFKVIADGLKTSLWSIFPMLQITGLIASL